MKIIIFLLCLTLLGSIFQVFAAPAPVKFITANDYQKEQNKVILLDVRSQNSRTKSNRFLAGSDWLDPGSQEAFADFIFKADKTAAYVIFCSCKHDQNSIRLARQLSENGFTNVAVLKGGVEALQSSGIRLTPLDPNKDCGCSIDWPIFPPQQR